MRETDIVDLILLTVLQQANTADVREDELLRVLITSDEVMTLSDTSTNIFTESHPVKWDNPLWSRATWGEIP